MKKILFLGLITLILYSSCKRETNWIVTDTYPSGDKKVEQEYYVDDIDTTFIFQKVLDKSGNLQVEGALESGERNGMWKSYYPNGLVWSETGFSKGKIDGSTKTFYPNGKLRYSGFYTEGEKAGEWIWYDSTGTFLKKVNFQEKKEE